MLRIKEVLKEKRLSVNELAEKLGITRVAVSKMINGTPNLQTLLKISEVLDCDIRDLITPTKGNKTDIYIKKLDEYKCIGNIDLNLLNLLGLTEDKKNKSLSLPYIPV